jgi:cell division protein FtsB
MRFRGRHWIALWLVAFLATTWLVYARQTAAIRAARELADLRARRADLEGQRADLERRVRAAQSRAVLVPRAQTRLGLHLPSDSEIILLPVPGNGSH